MRARLLFPYSFTHRCPFFSLHRVFLLLFLKMVCNVCGNPDGPCRAKTRDCSFFISELLVTSEEWMVHFNTLFFVFILCFCEIYLLIFLFITAPMYFFCSTYFLFCMLFTILFYFLAECSMLC
jgi:hypothetical protein